MNNESIQQFTDDDLKRVKGHIADVNSGNDFVYWGIDRLLARLEAAEAYAEARARQRGKDCFPELFEAWRQAAGK